MIAPSNWWEHFFEGLSVDLWLGAMSAEHTTREADVVERALQAPAGGDLLDVPCGGGRLSLELAGRGYRVTGVDLSGEFLAHARSCAGAETVSWQHRDMRDLPWPGRFDGAFCLGNSFGYLDDEGNAEFLRAVWTALKPGARFVLETPMVLENLLPHIQDRPWWKAGDIYLLAANQYDQLRGRLEIEYTFISDGRIEVRRGSHRAYRYIELHEMFRTAGFDATALQPWTREARSVTFVATRKEGPV
jgi:SAM-dependent methyltransferase